MAICLKKYLMQIIHMKFRYLNNGTINLMILINWLF